MFGQWIFRAFSPKTAANDTMRGLRMNLKSEIAAERINNELKLDINLRGAAVTDNSRFITMGDTSGDNHYLIRC